jgi:hypothetical protein
MSTPWKSDQWFTSPWNFADEVKETHNFAKDIKFHDVSLRDGEQQAGLVFNKDQKVALAEKIAEVGFQRIEAGMPAVSPQDAAAIKEIVKRNLGPDIFAFSRCMKPDVERAVDCGVKHIVIEIPASEHILEHAYKWSLEKAIELSIEATLYAKENGLYTVFFPIDGSRADMDTFLDIIQRVETEGHMDALVCVDRGSITSRSKSTSTMTTGSARRTLSWPWPRGRTLPTRRSPGSASVPATPLTRMSPLPC